MTMLVHRCERDGIRQDYHLDGYVKDAAGPGSVWSVSGGRVRACGCDACVALAREVASA